MNPSSHSLDPSFNGPRSTLHAVRSFSPSLGASKRDKELAEKTWTQEEINAFHEWKAQR